MKHKFQDYKIYGEKPAYEKIKYLDEKYSMPLYIYDINMAVENTKEMKELLGKNIGLCYSAKANYFLTEAVAEITEEIEVSTRGELEYCLQRHISAEKLVYSGVFKAKEDLKIALEEGVTRFVLDSVNQVSQLQDIAVKPVQILLRLSSGNQFGMDTGEIVQIMENTGMYCNLDIVGIHYYAGTQRCSVCQVEKDFKDFSMKMQYLKDRGIEFEEVQIGGGIGVPLYESDRTEAFEETAEYIINFVRKLSLHHKVIYECGRVIAANTGRYIARVFEKKHRMDREILLIHGGNNHLSYYGNIVGQRQPYIDSITKKEIREKYKYMICGSLCSGGDILAREYTDCGIEAGDYMIFYNAGAYSLQEASTLFLSAGMPQILLYNKHMKEQKLFEVRWTYYESTSI